MGFRFRRSVKIFPGFRINLSGRGASVSLGVRGFHYTIGSKGTRVTAGIPGTGLSWTQYTPYSNRVRTRPTITPSDGGTVVVPIESVPAKQINASSTSELAPALNNAHRPLRIAPLVIVACLCLPFIAARQGSETLSQTSNVASRNKLQELTARENQGPSIDSAPRNQGASKQLAEKSVPVLVSATPTSVSTIKTENISAVLIDFAKPNEVKRVQQRLIDLGFLFGAADGIWGQGSRRALRDFRAANGLGEGDTWDEATRERLLRARNVKAANTDISFTGGWGNDLAECRDSPIKITARRAEAFGAACEFRSTEREGSNVWRLRAECASKTERWNATVRLTVSTSKLTWSSERGTTTYVRCPMASAAR